MIIRHTRGNVVWVDLEAPTREELHAITREFGIDPRVEQEIVNPTPYPLFVSSETYLYLILHFPTAEVKGGARNQEVDIIVGKNFLITARYEVVHSIHTLHKAFEAEELLGLPRGERDTNIQLIERVLGRLYLAMREEIEQVALRLEKIEEDIFDGKERETVRKISEVGRVLLRFDTTLARHEEPLVEFLTRLESVDFFGKRFKPQSVRIEAERDHVVALVNSYREVTRELRSTNDSLLSTSQNEATKTFTAIALATFPPTAIAGIFAMHAKSAPIMGMENDFWIILGIIIVVDVLIFLFLRVKKWV